VRLVDGRRELIPWHAGNVIATPHTEDGHRLCDAREARQLFGDKIFASKAVILC
jgi:hypothetical protein